MTLGTSTRFLLVATRAPDRRMQSHSGYAYYKPSPWTSSKTSSPRSAQRGVREALARRHNAVRSVCAPRPPQGCSGKGLRLWLIATRFDLRLAGLNSDAIFFAVGDDCAQQFQPAAIFYLAGRAEQRLAPER
jgi:hypothetical protein